MTIRWYHILIFILLILLLAVVLHPTTFRTGWMFSKSGKPLEAISKFEEVYKKDPSNYRAMHFLARSYEELGDPKQASLFYEKLVKTKPSDSNFKELVRFYTWTNQPDARLKAYEEWYKFRRDSKKTVTDRAGKKLLTELYSAYMLAQNYDKALEIFTLRRNADPEYAQKSSDEYLSLIEKTGNADSIISAIEDILKKNPSDVFAISKLLDVAVASGKKALAEQILAGNITDRPNDPNTWRTLIDFETRLKDYKTANDWYVKWLASEPDNWPLKKKYVYWMLGTEQQKAAINYIEALLQTKPADPFYFDTLVSLYEWNSMDAKLLPIYMSRFNDDPANKENAEKLLWTSVVMKRYDIATSVLGKLMAMYPNDRKYVMAMLSIISLSKNPTAMIDFLERHPMTNRDPELLKLLGQQYLAVDRTEKAFDTFLRLIEMTPKDADAYHVLGDIASGRKDFKMAIGYYERYAELRPAEYYPRYRLADLNWSIKKRDLAKEDYKETVELIDNLKKPDRAALLAKARSLGILGDYNASENLFDELLETRRGDIDTANAEISMLIEAGQLDKALALAMEYNQDFPDNYPLRRNIARIHVLKNKPKEAESEMLTMMQTNADDLSLKTDYAYLLSQEGKWDKALPIFEELVKADPENNDLRKTRNDLLWQARPTARFGFDFRKTGSQLLYGPYVKYHQPIDSHWAFDVNYNFRRVADSIPGYDNNFRDNTNSVEIMGRYKPHRDLTLGLGMFNQFAGTDYAPAPHINAEWNNPKTGRIQLDYVYNRLFDDPASALYFGGRKDSLRFAYDKRFIDRLIFEGLYQSNWYRVEPSKTGMGLGKDFGREDVAMGGLHALIFNKNPEWRLGYRFTYSKLHVVNNYLPIIPLIQEQQRSEIMSSLTYKWNDWWTMDVGAFVGGDPKRDLKFTNLDLYGFRTTNRVKLSNRSDLLGHYEYSSEAPTNNVPGRYNYFFLEFLYRF